MIADKIIGVCREQHGSHRAAPGSPGKHRCQPVRKPFPDELPRVTIELLPPEVEREGLDQFELLGVMAVGTDGQVRRADLRPGRVSGASEDSKPTVFRPRVKDSKIQKCIHTAIRPQP